MIKIKYKKTENNTWSSLVRTCEDEKYQTRQVSDQLIPSVYSVSVFCTLQANVNCGF